MTLVAGTRVGAYEIVALLGAGGMGEVYRARDAKLGRDVALKILPEAFATDADRLARFEREARTLAALNHPNIAQLYGVEHTGGHPALVLELVEGEDLAARAARGPIPIDDAVPIARQIALALEAAHDQGIVHRDLKPANIKVRPDGTVKVLDFGLAKDVGAATSSLSVSPTFTAPATGLGVILGTAAYMSPEQAKGRSVDKRTDIWAFGAMLYEIIAGRRAFGGDDFADTLTAIIRDAPAWDALPADTPPSIRTLLRRCLEKDTRKRLRDIGEARIVLEEDPAARSTAASPARMTSPTTWLSWSVAAVLLLILVAMGAWVWLRPRPVESVQKFHIAPQINGSPIAAAAISPDGRHVAYVARSRVWVQPLDAWQPRELPGTEGGVRPFWSPDSTWIGFFRSEEFLKVPVAGGGVVRMATLPAVQAPLNANSAVWREDGTIVVSLADGPLLQVPSSGGEARPFFEVPSGMGRDLHDLSPLPNDSMLAAIHREAGIDAIGVVAKGALRIVFESPNTDLRQPEYSPSGHIVFQRGVPNAGLWAIAFDADRLQAQGGPFLVSAGSEPSVSGDGTLAFRGDPEDLARQLAWFTMEGVVGSTIAAPQEWIEGVSLSADGRRLLASSVDGIWVYDIGTGARSRITRGRTDIMPRWIGKTGRLAFVRGDRAPVVMIKSADAGSDEQIVASDARFPSATADGTRLVFNQGNRERGVWEIAWVDLARPSVVNRLGPAHSGARFPDVSPDGGLVAYVSGEIGKDEIFVTRLPGGEGKWQLSTKGGGWVRFTPRGDGAVYRAPDGEFVFVPITTSALDVTIGRPKRLFEWGSGWLPFYDLAADGLRGVAAVPVAHVRSVPSVSIVRNWHMEFLRR